MTEKLEPTPLAGMAPMAGNERISAVDTLRGVAVLGILVMNIYAFAMPFMAYNNPLMLGGTEWYNLGTWFFTHVFFDQKFMTIFSLLFGGGIVIMWERARARGASLGKIFYRRQLWLLVIGAAHAYLLWMGDILFHYALVGMLVFLFRRASPRRLIVLACVMLPVAPLLAVGSSVYMEQLQVAVAEIAEQTSDGATLTDEQTAMVSEWESMAPFIAPGPEELDADLAAYRGDYAGIVSFRVPTAIMMQTQAVLFFFLWRVGGLMLLGMALMKMDILSGKRSATFYRRLMLVGYGAGLPLMAMSAYLLHANRWDGIFMFGVGGLPNYVGSILVASGHIAAVMLIVKSGALASLMTRFTAVGRMALSNYLMHTLVMTSLFYGYGLGLYGSVPRAAQMLLVIAMIGVQLWLSPLWLERYRFGPAEWLWRSLTYWKRQPMRQPAST